MLARSRHTNPARVIPSNESQNFRCSISDKAVANLRKHNVSFETATEVFNDAALLDLSADDDHGEMRYQVVGMVDGRLLHVTYTMRGDLCRLISARQAERHERRAYHEV